MQIFVFGALAISVVGVLFALQNNVTVTVSFLWWTFDGSLALVLVVALVAGALISVLASVPGMVRRRMATTESKKQIAALETSLAACQQELRSVSGGRQSPGTDSTPPVATSGSDAPQSSPTRGATVEPRT